MLLTPEYMDQNYITRSLYRSISGPAKRTDVIRNILKQVQWKMYFFRPAISFTLRNFIVSAYLASVVFVFLKFWHFSPERKETGSLGATGSEVWIGNFNVKAWKTTKHKLHKIWRSLKFCKNSGNKHNPGAWKVYVYYSPWLWTFTIAGNRMNKSCRILQKFINVNSTIILIFFQKSYSIHNFESHNLLSMVNFKVQVAQ